MDLKTWIIYIVWWEDLMEPRLVQSSQCGWEYCWISAPFASSSQVYWNCRHTVSCLISFILGIEPRTSSIASPPAILAPYFTLHIELIAALWVDQLLPQRNIFIHTFLPLIFSYVESFAFMYICVLHVCLVPKEAGKGLWMPWNWKCNHWEC